MVEKLNAFPCGFPGGVECGVQGSRWRGPVLMDGLQAEAAVKCNPICIYHAFIQNAAIAFGAIDIEP